MSADAVKTIRVLAMRDVLAKDATPAYALRHVFRWYSQRFHTPLHVIADLPTHDILQAYYETVYEELRDGENEKALLVEIEELVTSPEEARQKLSAAAQDEEETRRMVAEAEADNRKAAARKAARDALAAAAPAKPISFVSPEASLGVNAKADPTPLRLPALGVDNPAPQDKPQGIRMSFASIEELDRLAESDGLDGVEPVDFGDTATLPGSKLAAARSRS